MRTARRAAQSIPIVVSASAGLGSRDVSAGDLVAVFDWLDRPDLADGPRWASLGVRHPSALEPAAISLRPAGAYSLRGHSIGGLGSVTTNKLLATIMGELFGKHVQAYPRYGSEKKGLPTTYFLTLADEPIRLHAELKTVDFVPLHDVSGFHQGALAGLVDGGTVFVQSALTDPAAIWASVPERAREEITRRAHPPRSPSIPPRWRVAARRARSSCSACRAWPWSASSSAFRRSPRPPATTASGC